MASNGARLEVAAPVADPLPFGLLQSAKPVDETDEKWLNGVWFQPEVCDAAGVTSDPCPTPPATKAATSTGMPSRGTDPFTVYAWISCSAPSFEDKAREHTNAALTNGEAFAVEHEFWTGAAGTRPHLAANAAVMGDGLIEQTAATILTSGAVDVVEAIALLEGALASCYSGRRGMIHVPYAAIANLAAFWQIEHDRTKITTVGGTLIVPGGGYPGTSPAGAAPAAGTGWFYATGQVRYTRSAISNRLTTAESLKRSTNSMVMIAERTYALGWDCCHFAAQVSLKGVVAGT